MYMFAASEPRMIRFVNSSGHFALQSLASLKDSIIMRYISPIYYAHTLSYYLSASSSSSIGKEFQGKSPLSQINYTPSRSFYDNEASIRILLASLLLFLHYRTVNLDLAFLNAIVLVFAALGIR
jgi:hypothetical protein